jgi:hypothetical protein
MVTIYHYDEKTGHYIGQGVAPSNPAEPSAPLLPAHSTTVPPPSGPVRFDPVVGDWLAAGDAKAAPVVAVVPEVETKTAPPNAGPEKVQAAEQPSERPTKGRKSRRR